LIDEYVEYMEEQQKKKWRAAYDTKKYNESLMR
jgi:hypothetical protein